MASKRRLRRRSCKGKHPYDSEGEANQAVRGLRKSFNQPGTWISYPCRWCGKWHVGRPDKQKRRRNRGLQQARLAERVASLSEKQSD